MARESRFTTSLRDMDTFPPTVVGHTKYKDGYRLHTLDPDEDTDIDIFTDEE